MNRKLEWHKIQEGGGEWATQWTYREPGFRIRDPHKVQILKNGRFRVWLGFNSGVERDWRDATDEEMDAIRSLPNITTVQRYLEVLWELEKVPDAEY